MKTSELSGAALDWAVAMLEGDLVPTGGVMIQTWPYYSSDWAQGGPIIEREKLWLQPEIGMDDTGGAWYCVAITPHEAYGPTPLIAAMRCYVASKLGDEIELPEELK
jgi:hypothetical protein